MANSAANIAAYTAILKEAYDDSNGVNEQINNEVEVLNLFKKGIAEWQGKKLIVPAHVGRNTGVGNITEGGKLPDAGHQVDVDFIVTNKILAARGQVSRSLMKAAPSKGAGAFLSYMSGEVDRLKDDAVDLCDLRAVSGGIIKGYVNEHKTDNATAGAFVPGGASGAGADVVWEYAGEFACFQARGLKNSTDPSSENFSGVVPGDTNTWVRVQLTRQDTYAEIVPAGGAATIRGIFVKNFDADLGTITMVGVANAAASQFDTGVTGIGRAIAVGMHPTQLTDGAGNKFGGVYDASPEQSGIFTNLSAPSHYTVDRTTSTGFQVLQSTILTGASVAGAHARVDISVKRMQACKDRIRLASKARAEICLVNPLQIQSYIALTVTQSFYKTNEGGGKADASPDDESVTYAGKGIKTARHVPRGMVIFLTAKSWVLEEYAPGSFIDEDGNFLSRVPDHDAMEFAWTWEFNILCRRPNSNGILCGLKLE